MQVNKVTGVKFTPIIMKRMLILLCVIVLIISITLVISFNKRQYNYTVLLYRVLNWNLRELDVYPEYKLIYFGIMNKDEPNEYYQVGVYPGLNDELEKQIRKLGYPFNYKKIRYVGTDDFTDIERYMPYHPLGLEVTPYWVRDLIGEDDPVYEFKYEDFFGT